MAQQHTYPTHRRAPAQVSGRGLIISLVGGLISVVAVRRVRQAVALRAGNQVVLDHKRHTNKRWNNRVIKTIGRAGKPYSPFALLHHQGRRSGTQYMTPIRLVREGNHFTIPLTYGEQADWYRTLQAAHSADIAWQGNVYHVGEPELLEAWQARSKFPLPSRFLFWLDGVPAFVQVTTAAEQGAGTK